MTLSLLQAKRALVTLHPKGLEEMADTTKVREALRALIYELRLTSDWAKSAGGIDASAANAIGRALTQGSEALAALDSAAQEGAGPVAWQLVWSSGAVLIASTHEEYVRGMAKGAATVRPLYTTPQPSPSGPVAIPDGWQLVPSEPDGRMGDAGAFHCITGAGAAARADVLQARRVYAAMLAAAPVPPAHDAEGKVDGVMVERALFARVPGGAQVKDWLPSSDDRGQVPHETARVVVRAALEAALSTNKGQT